TGRSNQAVGTMVQACHHRSTPGGAREVQRSARMGIRRWRASWVLSLCGLLLTFVVTPEPRAADGDFTGTGLLGSTPVNISVDPFSGTASSGYAFVVPPGRSGMQPDLS